MSDQAVLIEKRKSFLSNTRNTPEILINNNFINLLIFFEHDDLINFVENKHLTQLVINKNEFLKNFKNKLTLCDTVDDLSAQAINYGLQINTNYQNSLLKDFQFHKSKITQELCEKLDAKINQFLLYNRMAKNEFYDSSVWGLYFCYGILSGKIVTTNQENTLIRAPLINIEVEINFDAISNNITILKRSDDPVANEILEINLDTTFNCKTQLSELLEVEQLSVTSYFEEISKSLQNVTLGGTQIEISKKYENNLAETNFTINKNCILALCNPLGGKMLRDYNEVLKTDYSFPVVKTLFNDNENEMIYQNDRVLEINRPLNLIQKLAIANALKNNLLIYGPPGTGKSEVVTNIIANVIAENKSVLVVSEKKAALDVLEQRLGYLNSVTLFAFDKNFSETFYKKILQLNELILNSKPTKIIVENSKFIKLNEYFSLIDGLLEYHDFNGTDFQHLLKIYHNINLKLFKNHLPSIKFLYEEAINNVSLEHWVSLIDKYRQMSQIWESLLPGSVIHHHLFDQEKLRLFFILYEKANDKNKKHLLNNFIKNGTVKKIILSSKIALNYENNIPELIKLLRLIKTSEIKYLENFKDLNQFLLDVNSFKDYLIYYDWSMNTSLNQLINNLLTADINTLISNYWSCKKHAAAHFDLIIRDQYICNLQKKIKSFSEYEYQWVELIRKANLTKKHSLTKVIKQHYEILKLAFPIWILSPDKAASIIPLKIGEFEFGIFDEASQMKFERGIPLVYRCAKVIVSGDDKQLKPTTFFSKSIDLDDEYDGHLDNVDSLLDKAKTSNWMNFTLSNHYRSQTEELIYFSNHYIYDQHLFCITKNGWNNNSIDVYAVNGTYDRAGENVNPTEAKKVIDLVLENYQNYQKIIVVTFNQKQCDYIENAIFTISCLQNALESQTIKIKSLENVQGDEADLIIISTTFGKDKDGNFYQNFGPLGQDGGKNRLNVMITRARDKIILVKSFMASDITTTSNQNTLLFKNFINYAEQIQNNKDLLNNMQTSQNNDLVGELCEAVFTKLKNEPNYNNYLIETNKKIGTHNIDITISKLNSTTTKICILVDDYDKLLRNHTKNFKWIQIIDKQKYLEDRGYKTIRINPIEWYLNNQQIMDKIFRI